MQSPERGRPGRSSSIGAGVVRISGVVADAEPLRAGTAGAPGEILAAREDFGARHLCRFSVRVTDRVGPAATLER